MKSTEKILWGMALVILGCIIGLNALNIIDVDIFFDGWWTLFIIIPCLIGLFTNEDKKTNLICLILGVLLLINAQGFLTWKSLWGLVITAILIIIGLSIIFGSVLRDKTIQKIEDSHKKNNNSENKIYSTIFASNKIDLAKEELTTCKVNATFGEMICDLRGTKIKDSAIIYANALFGNIKIITPKGVNIKVKSSSIFGEVDDKSLKDKDSKATLLIDASSIFGEIDII